MLEFNTWNFTNGVVAGMKAHATVHCQCETDVDEVAQAAQAIYEVAA